jgi:hypothetical protein
VKLGAERKKVIVLVLLLAVAGVLFYQQFFGEPDLPAARPAPAKTLPAARTLRATADEILDPQAGSRPRTTPRTSFDFKPSLKKSKPGEGPDPLKLDPTLRTDLLARLRAVEYAGVERNVFQFGAAKPKVTPEQIAEAKKKAAEAEAKLSAPSNGPPPEPTAPPVNMKYYGYASRPGDPRRRAFLIEGEEIIVAAEGEVINKRYRVVRIGVNSLVVEDLQFKSQQTLPLQES